MTTTSGLAWKIPGRVGDSPILGAGLWVDGEVGAAGSTGRGEANLFNLSSHLIVEEMRRGRHPKDAAMEALRRIRANTVEKRLLQREGQSRLQRHLLRRRPRRPLRGRRRCTAGQDADSSRSAPRTAPRRRRASRCSREADRPPSRERGRARPRGHPPRRASGSATGWSRRRCARWDDALLAAASRRGTRVYLKEELFQRTGTFKPRGALSVMLGPRREDALARGVTAVSAGQSRHGGGLRGARAGHARPRW